MDTRMFNSNDKDIFKSFSEHLCLCYFFGVAIFRILEYITEIRNV